jgi:hypothetical protein
LIGGNAASVAEAEDGDQPFQAAIPLPEVVAIGAGKGGRGDCGRDSTIGGSIFSPVQSEERRQQRQSEEIREDEAAVTVQSGVQFSQDCTIGGSISSPVQSGERRQQSEETRELEEAETGGESIVQRTNFTALSKQA